MTHEMETKLYTVKQVAHMAQVTVKTLHHYDALGLLHPTQISDAGYRLYGYADLERLQQILFYRELDFPLKQIKSLLQETGDRKKILLRQRDLLLERKERLGQLIETIHKSIWYVEQGDIMNTSDMFQGFANEEEWRAALADHDKHLAATYGIKTSAATLDASEMNSAAQEAVRFTQTMAAALRNKISAKDPAVQDAVKKHVAYLNAHGHPTSPKEYLQQTKFLMEDQFHGSMLEDQQIGLSYYLYTAAGVFAANGEEA